jgi:hypothetical protein
VVGQKVVGQSAGEDAAQFDAVKVGTFLREIFSVENTQYDGIPKPELSPDYNCPPRNLMQSR